MRDRPAGHHSIEAEQAVLGALLIDSSAWPRIADRLSAADFLGEAHRTIFAAIAELNATGKAADMVTVAEFLERRGQLTRIGGLAALGPLTRETPSAANVEAYAEVVRDRSLLRGLEAFAAQTASALEDSSGAGAAEIIGRAQERLLELQASARTGGGLVSSAQLAGELVDDLDSRRGRPTGLQIGLADFDTLTNGLEPGDLVVIAGRPGMGKTALLVSVAEHVSRQTPTAVFSAEMPARQLMRRCLALVGGISQGRFRRAEQLTDADWEAISPAAAQLAERRLWIDDTALPSLTHVRAECLALKARSGLGLVLIDYVQLLQGRGNNRYEQLRDIAYGCKALAKDLAVPMVLLAQLNRGVEARDQKRPHLSDLRDSGAIEEAADIVGLLYSEGYYDREFGMPYVLECRIDKHRNGERGECLWRFAGEFSQVSVLEPGPRAQYLQLRVKQNLPRRREATNDL